MLMLKVSEPSVSTSAALMVDSRMALSSSPVLTAMDSVSAMLSIIAPRPLGSRLVASLTMRTTWALPLPVKLKFSAFHSSAVAALVLA